SLPAGRRAGLRPAGRPVRRRPPRVHPADHRGRAVLPGPAAIPAGAGGRWRPGLPDREEASGMRTAIVVGSGAGGATVARELQGAFEVTVLEAGRPFRRLGLERAAVER